MAISLVPPGYDLRFNKNAGQFSKPKMSSNWVTAWVRELITMQWSCVGCKQTRGFRNWWFTVHLAYSCRHNLSLVNGDCMVILMYRLRNFGLNGISDDWKQLWRWAHALLAWCLLLFFDYHETWFIAHRTYQILHSLHGVYQMTSCMTRAQISIFHFKATAEGHQRPLPTKEYIEI